MDHSALNDKNIKETRFESLFFCIGRIDGIFCWML